MQKKDIEMKRLYIKGTTQKENNKKQRLYGKQQYTIRERYYTKKRLYKKDIIQRKDYLRRKHIWKSDTNRKKIIYGKTQCGEDYIEERLYGEIIYKKKTISKRKLHKKKTI